MTNVLFLVSDVGPAEGSVYSNLKSSGHRVFTYDITGRWVPREQSVPLWMKGYRTRLSPMARNWFRRIIEPKNIKTTIASGLSAAAFAANNLAGDFYPLLWRSDLDFGPSNHGLTRAFIDLSRTSDRLLLEDSWEMDKAVSKNSRLPHLRMRYPTPTKMNYLTSKSGNVAVIYPRHSKHEAETFRDSAQDAFGENVDIGLIDIRSLYTSADLAKGLDLYDQLAHRLEKYSFAIILGTGPHHSALIRALADDKDRVVVEQTVGMSFLSEELELPHRARGLRCIQEMKHILEHTDLSATHVPVTSSTSKTDDFLVTLQELWQKDVDPHFEELPALLDDGPLNIFFSVGTVQDITKGARHQRVRNMHDAFRQIKTFNIFGGQPFFSRRLQFARKLLNQGRPAGLFYGENSTSPMTRPLIKQLGSFLQEFSNMDGRSMWFVRDLHWLESFQTSPWTQERTQELISDGLYELREVGDRTDVLGAPSQASGEKFNALLTEARERPREWHPLPPAIQPQNVIDDSDLGTDDGVTLLYAGGISEIYGMELYLSAIRDLDMAVLLDFVVREPEAAPLKLALDRLGLLSSERTRILHTTMDLYQPRSSRTFGMVLLDSEYAKFSFPYKTVTMIERGYPILCYSDMGIADFVTSNDVGVAVERTADSIREGITALLADGAPGINKVRKAETWENRVQEVCEVLSRGVGRNTAHKRS